MCAGGTGCAFVCVGMLGVLGGCGRALIQGVRHYPGGLYSGVAGGFSDPDTDVMCVFTSSCPGR